MFADLINLFLFFFILFLQHRNTTKSFETKYFDLHSEKNNLERQIMSDEAKSRDLYQKINDLQVNIGISSSSNNPNISHLAFFFNRTI